MNDEGDRGEWHKKDPIPMASDEDYFMSCLAQNFKFFPYGRYIGVVVIAVVDKDHQESTRKKQKALLRLVDPRREAKMLRPSAKGSAAVATMLPPTELAASARKVPSLAKASEVEGAKGTKIGGAGDASRELSVDDYLIEGVSMFDAHTRLAAGGECIYHRVSFYDGVCILVRIGFWTQGRGLVRWL